MLLKMRNMLHVKVRSDMALSPRRCRLDPSSPFVIRDRDFLALIPRHARTLPDLFTDLRRPVRAVPSFTNCRIECLDVSPTLFECDIRQVRRREDPG